METSKPVKSHYASLIDEIRGADIILMILYHLGYDLVYIFGVNLPYYESVAMPYIQPVIAGTFIFISGISCRYSRSNVKRGLKTFICAMILTVVTLCFMPGESIYFGILHFMASAMILFSLMRPALDIMPPFAGFIASVVCYMLTLKLPYGYIGIEGLFTVNLPQWLYRQKLLLPLGFYGMGSDYFPIIPYLFLFFAGAYMGVYIAGGRFPDLVYRQHSKMLALIGRRTLIIYMLHQPVIMGILWGISRLK